MCQDNGFTATGDDGREYVVSVSWTASDPPAFVLRTGDGHAVAVVRRGWYRVPATGVRLRSDAPDAPGPDGRAACGCVFGAPASA